MANMTNTHLDDPFIVVHDNLSKFTDWQIEKLYQMLYVEIMERNLGEYTSFEEAQEA